MSTAFACGDHMNKTFDCILLSDLIEIGSCVDMLCLKFSKDNHLYCLHIQSDWSVRNKENTIVCKKDMYVDRNTGKVFDSYFNTYEMTNSLFAFKLRQFNKMKMLPLKVIKINLDSNNLCVELENGYHLCTRSYNNYYGELWRLFEKGNYDVMHLVAYNTGLTLE